MRKILIFAVLVSAFSMTSCKRKYTCECHTSTGIARTYELKMSKKDANASCEVSHRSYSTQGGYCDLQ